jgi:hypothetical protein
MHMLEWHGRMCPFEVIKEKQQAVLANPSADFLTNLHVIS